MTRKAVQLALGGAVAALFLWLTLRDMDAAVLRAAAAGLRAPWIAAAMGFLALGYVARVRRWRSMLLPHNPGLGMGRAGVAFLGSIAVNNLLPFRAGDVLRSFGFCRWLGVPSAPVLASVLVERLLDLVTLILALALALLVFQPGGESGALLHAGAGGLALLGLVSAGLLFRPALLDPLIAAVLALLRPVSPAAARRLAGFADPLRRALADLARGRRMAGLFLWSLAVWACEGAGYWAIARALPQLHQPEAAWLVMPVGTLSTLLPSTPGHVGTFDFFARTAAEAAGNAPAAATAYALVSHVAFWLPLTLVGSGCLIWWALRRDDGKGAA